MSGFIHITEKTPAWQKALRMSGALAAVLGAFAWFVLGDEGLPMSTPAASGSTPFVKAVPLPPPPRVAMETEAHADRHDEAHEARLAQAAAKLGHDDEQDDDYATRNAGVDVRRLTLLRHQTARSFLSDVLLAPGAQSGFVVAEVQPESLYARMGLKPGDVVYTLDTPGTPEIDETSMVALMQRSELSLEVYRNGTLTRLHTHLAHVENGDALPAP